MSKISRDDIEKVSKLARIGLNVQETADMAIEVSSILSFVETIQAVNTDGIEPTSQVTGLTDVWREDEIKKSPVSPKEILAEAPQVQDGYVKVKSKAGHTRIVGESFPLHAENHITHGQHVLWNQVEAKRTVGL